ncbi:MAG TPA: alpha/beta fold hydrolase [Caulobacteraceae bacterium]|nr:alpha/beta fold hydrolase [Caulobacteraceae bacterium]
MLKWLRRGAAALVGLVLVAVAGGAAYEATSRAKARESYPPPGRLVDLGGRRLQLDCRGEGSPVVVFQSGLDAMGSLSWSRVHDDVAKVTRACAYSRAGLMWSDPSPWRFSAGGAADDLHQALLVAGERPPYVLVAHSLGGPYALVYAHRYAFEIAGLVLVEASHPDQAARLDAAAGRSIRPESSQLALGDALAWTGLVRLVTARDPFGPPGTPAAVAGPGRAYLPSSVHALRAETDAVPATLAAARADTDLGDLPLIVLTRGTSAAPSGVKLPPGAAARIDAAWRALQDDETHWSTRGRHEVVADATHYIQFDRPDAVVDAVRDVVRQARAPR